MLWFGIPAVISVIIGFIMFYRFPVLSLKARNTHSSLKISIIIPARNEENNLPTLLASLKNQMVLPHEIIVVDDNSVDGTAMTANEKGAKVITSGKLPGGWLGKPWSCYHGAGMAEGDVFIFLDADVYLEPDALEKIMCHFNLGSGVISIFPYHRIKKFHEAFSAIFNLMQLAGMYKNNLQKNPEPAGMFGPCLVISREDYFKSGGHRAVQGEVLENYVMADILKKHDIPVRLFSGKKTVNVRMYPEGWNSLFAGWSKSFSRGADLTPRLNMYLSIMWISGLIASSVFLLYSLFANNMTYMIFWAVVYLICVFHMFILFRFAGNFPLWSALFYPVILIFFLTLFSFASYRVSKNKPVEWKGRKIS